MHCRYFSSGCITIQALILDSLSSQLSSTMCDHVSPLRHYARANRCIAFDKISTPKQTLVESDKEQVCVGIQALRNHASDGRCKYPLLKFSELRITCQVRDLGIVFVQGILRH